jgi:hypothetical protein
MRWTVVSAWLGLLLCASISQPVHACSGDCRAVGVVSVSDLVTAVAIALDQARLETCAAIDADGDGRASVGELVTAVGHALEGCPTAVDQHWEGPVGDCDRPSTIFQILAHQPIGQEFSPTRPLLGAVEVYVRAANPPYSGTLTLNLRQAAIDGALLASVTRALPFDPGRIHWERFAFAAPVAVEPGETHVIELLADNASLMWLTDIGSPPCDPDAYRGGRGILLGETRDWDAYFRTLAISD